MRRGAIWGYDGLVSRLLCWGPILRMPDGALLFVGWLLLSMAALAGIWALSWAAAALPWPGGSQ